ncbi:MAG: hypothetical protein ILNGONEN_00815 [Syntrophorhabdaceae bacterium]|nr:hypothetical protein [Syntrophorhabdaceae bacterium]
MGDLVNFTTVIVSVLQTILIIVTIFYTRHHFKLERAASYIARFNSEDMIRNRAVVEGWLSAQNSDEVKIKKLTDDTELAIRVYTFINLFQEIGVAYKNKMIHRSSAEGYYSYLIISYWKRIQFLIEWRRRKENRPTLYEDFQFLAEILAKKGDKTFKVKIRATKKNLRKNKFNS